MADRLEDSGAASRADPKAASQAASHTTLVVVDSLARARTLQDLSRGRDVEILACPGDLRQLELGGERSVEPRWSWDPQRQRAQRELRAAADRAQHVLLATDPDARGELRASHLAAVLEPRPVLRLWLDALTREAFDEAVSAAQPLDGRLIEAELTRRIGHRLVAAALAGLAETPLVAATWAAALLLQRVAERDARVSAWRPEPGLRLRARLRSPTGRELDAELLGRVRGSDGDAVCASLEDAAWQVQRVRSQRRAAPAPRPMDVAALVAAAEDALRFPSARTLEIARRLYEGKPSGPDGARGLITWHISAGGTRPTDPGRAAGDLAPHLAQDECALYSLIHEADRRASRAAEPLRETRLLVEAEGWSFESEWPASAPRPAEAGLRRGVPLVLEELTLVSPEAAAPPRLSEAQGVAELSAIGLASPEEVPPLIGELEEAGLLVRRGVQLHPTRQGQRLLERIGAEHPELLDARRARDFAREVAGVAAGRHGRLAVLAPFERWLRGETAPSAPEPAPVRRRPGGLGLRCPRCGEGEIVERRKRGGQLPFYACNRYPECRFTSSARPVPGPCPGCGAPLLRVRARRTFCAETGCGWAWRTPAEPIIDA